MSQHAWRDCIIPEEQCRSVTLHMQRPVRNFHIPSERINVPSASYVGFSLVQRPCETKKKISRTWKRELSCEFSCIHARTLELRVPGNPKQTVRLTNWTPALRYGKHQKLAGLSSCSLSPRAFYHVLLFTRICFDFFSLHSCVQRRCYTLAILRTGFLAFAMLVANAKDRSFRRGFAIQFERVSSNLRKTINTGGVLISWEWNFPVGENWSKGRAIRSNLQTHYLFLDYYYGYCYY